MKQHTQHIHNILCHHNLWHKPQKNTTYATHTLTHTTYHPTNMIHTKDAQHAQHTTQPAITHRYTTIHPSLPPQTAKGLYNVYFSQLCECNSNMCLSDNTYFGTFTLYTKLLTQYFS